jgi:MFS family permease
MPTASRPISRRPFRLPARLDRWLERWGGLLPLFAAEFVIWLGFGGLLPVLPIYIATQGIDFTTLGLVIAAWPAARLVSEPIFGWIADRTARVPLMVTGLVVGGVCGALPFVFTGPLWFLALRAGAGLGAAIYDPAARGYLTDATPPERRGEAFGLYGAAQMGGLLLGPTIGGFGAATFGGMGFVFAFTAVTGILGAIAVGLRVREGPVATRTPASHALESIEFPADGPYLEGRLAAERESRDRGAPATAGTTIRLLNRGLIGAIVINFGANYASGTYEVVWSLFLARLGADLALIGLTFATFGLPVLLISPVAGRLVDRRGALALIVVGSILPAVTGVLYTFLTDPALAVPLILVESTGVALLAPALYVIVAANSPPGRSSTAQGLFGAAGTLGVILASLISGALAEISILYPFYLFAAVMIGCLIVGLLVGGRRLRASPSRSPAI